VGVQTGTESESGRQLLPSEQAGLVCLQSVAAEPEQPTRLLSRRLQAIDASRFRSDTTATAPLPWRVFSTLTSKQNSLPSAVNRLRDKSLSRRWGGGGGQLVGTRAVFNADSAGATRGWRNDTGTPPVQLKLQAVVHALAALQTYVNRRRQATSDLQALDWWHRHKGLHAPELPQAQGDHSAQLIVAEVELVEGRQACKGGRDLAATLVARKGAAGRGHAVHSSQRGVR
jgi:hypothetical protein